VRAVEHLYGQSVDVVLADDGLQHYAMRRIAELVVIDGERGLGNGRLLPAGPLRESGARLQEVDAVLLNGPSQCAGLTFTLEQQAAIAVNGAAKREVQAFAGQRVWSVAGIGNPQRFHTALRAHGLQVDEVAVLDHGVVDLDELRAQRQQPILMTEKDAVKYMQTPADCWMVPVQVKFSSSDSAIGEVLAGLEAKVAAFSPGVAT
jgi:tetraacyldisaccharide 4'-kinase